MSLRINGTGSIVLESPRQFFVERVDQALGHLKFDPLPLSRHYLVDLLQHFVFSRNLFQTDEETGKSRRDTLAEMYLKARLLTGVQRVELLKKLGDSSLYISGFFGDSLTRKIVDVEYYVDMGGVAYSELSTTATDESLSQVFNEYSRRFGEFVDVLTYISQEALIQTNEDLLKLYDRYMATGSRLAEGQLLEKGLLNVDMSKVRNNKM